MAKMLQMRARQCGEGSLTTRFAKKAGQTGSLAVFDDTERTSMSASPQAIESYSRARMAPGTFGSERCEFTKATTWVRYLGDRSATLAIQTLKLLGFKAPCNQ